MMHPVEMYFVVPMIYFWDFSCLNLPNKHYSLTLYSTPPSNIWRLLSLSPKILNFKSNLIRITCFLFIHFLRCLNLFCKVLHCFAFLKSSVQSLSCVQLFATPWTAARPASLSITNAQSLLKLMTIESVITSNHLILSFLIPSHSWKGKLFFFPNSVTFTAISMVFYTY